MEMKILFLLNFIISLGIFIFLSIKSHLFYKTKDYHKISFYFFVIGLLYLFLSLFSFVWFFGFLNYSPEDFLFLYSFLIVFQSLLFFRIIYFMSLHKKLLYLLMFYLIGVGSMLYSFETLLIFQVGNVYFFNLLLNLVFCMFIFIFIKDLQKIPLVSKGDLNKEPRPPFLGILAPFLLAILLFFIGGKFMKEMAFLLSGFNFLAIAKDLQDFGLSQNLIFAVLLLGGSFLIYGIIIISKLRIEDEVYLPGFN